MLKTNDDGEKRFDMIMKEVNETIVSLIAKHNLEWAWVLKDITKVMHFNILRSCKHCYDHLRSCSTCQQMLEESINLINEVLNEVKHGMEKYHR
ncbi:MAG: hypothetical protein AB1420_15975 [Bacillota bacterium]